MNAATLRLSSVTRWLLVVFGCAVLETAQPMIAAGGTEVPTPAATDISAAPEAVIPPARSDDTLLIPGGGAERVQPAFKTDGPPVSWIICLVLCAAGFGWWWWRRRVEQLGGMGASRGIAIEETRSLGNRQYLVVAAYAGQKFLLGVTPGQIQLVASLDPTKPQPEVSRET